VSETLTTIITFLGGGVIGAGIHYVGTAQSARESRHSSYVHEQLDRLYGPLYFLTNQNEKLLELSRKVLKTHSEYFDGSFSSDSQTQKVVQKESLETIELSNVYADQIVENNENIVTLLRANHSLVDTDDVELFTDFTIDAIRMNKEVKEERLKNIPLAVYKEIGDISYSKPAFLAQVKVKFIAKQDLLKKYH